MKIKDPTAYETDVLAEFADVDTALIPNLSITACVRDSGDLEPEQGPEHLAFMDPATRSNAWTLGIAKRHGGVTKICLTREWKPRVGEPLRPKAVLAEIADECRRYGVSHAYTDQYSADALVDIARDHGLPLIVEPWTAADRTQIYMQLAAEVAEGRVELPNDEQVLRDLRAIRKRVTQNGISVVLPQTSDGRHADFAPVIAKAVSKWMMEAPKQRPKPGTPEAIQAELDRMEQQEIDKMTNQNEWWQHN
jgi:hypothetical protein